MTPSPRSDARARPHTNTPPVLSLFRATPCRDAVVVDYAATGINEEHRQKAQVKSAEEAREVLRRIGYPAMLKASEGGGGKGIRKVTQEDQVEAAFRQVRALPLRGVGRGR